MRGNHYLYYVDFPFDHETWVSDDRHYNYISSRGALDARINYGLIYIDRVTNTYLYEKNK